MPRSGRTHGSRSLEWVHFLADNVTVSLLPMSAFLVVNNALTQEANQLDLAAMLSNTQSMVLHSRTSTDVAKHDDLYRALLRRGA